jgi:membrane protein DedA with SNARE-associated domain
MERVRNGLENATIPLCLSLFVLAAGLAHMVLPVPSFAELFATLQAFFREYGLPALLVAAFIEGIFLFSFYIPGSLVIVLGVIVSADDPKRLVAIGVACWIGVNLAMVVDYAIGRYGLHRLFARIGATAAVAGTERWMQRFGRAAIFLAAVHPNLLALVMVCAGIARAPLLMTLAEAAAATAAFIPLALLVAWAILRNIALDEANPLPVVLGLLLLWGAVLFIRGYSRNDRDRRAARGHHPL